MNKGYNRYRIREIRKKITDKQLFTSKPFLSSMDKIAKSLTLELKKKLKIVVSWDLHMSGRLACTTGKLILINAANPITRSFPTRELRTGSLVGLLSHECGHQKYSDMALRSLYGEGFEQGKIYPYPPKPENKTEEQALEQIKEFLLQKDKAAISVLRKTALFINNVLEDVYIEMRMCDEFPGSIRSGILLNATKMIDSFPTITQEIEQQDHSLVIMLNLILSYARAGEVHNWEGYEGEYLDCLSNCMETIDDAVVSMDRNERFHAANKMILKIWNYMEELVEEQNKKNEEPVQKANEETTQEEQNELLKKIFASLAAPEEECEEECCMPPEGWSGNLESEEAGDEKPQTATAEQDKTDENYEREEEKNWYHVCNNR